MRIDAHQHFWQVERGDYGWLTPELGVLYRDYAPADLKPLLAECNIDGTILVQAAPTLAETHYLLDIAADNDLVKGVVGWINFESPDAASEIQILASKPKLVGLRPMIQDIEDIDWMLKPQLHLAFEALIAADLCFDALVFPHHLTNLLTLLNRYPKMRVVIDHGAKPQIAKGEFDNWATSMTRLATESQAYCKLSGLVTEASTDWEAKDLEPYINHLIEVFGTNRLIWGSDWPVAKLATDYPVWHRLAAEYFSEAEQQPVFGENARRAYKI